MKNCPMMATETSGRFFPRDTSDTIAPIHAARADLVRSWRGCWISAWRTVELVDLCELVRGINVNPDDVPVGKSDSVACKGHCRGR